MVYPIKKRRLSYLNRRNARGCAMSPRVDSVVGTVVSRSWASPSFVFDDDDDEGEAMEETEMLCSNREDSPAECDVPQETSMNMDGSQTPRGSLEFLAAAAMLNIMRASSPSPNKVADTTTSDEHIPQDDAEADMAPEASREGITDRPLDTNVDAIADVSVDTKAHSQRADVDASPDMVPSTCCAAKTPVAKREVGEVPKEEQNVVSDDNSGSASPSYEDESESPNSEETTRDKRSPYKKRNFSSMDHAEVDEAGSPVRVKREETDTTNEPMEEEDTGVVGVLPLDMVAEAIEAAVAKTDSSNESRQVGDPPVPSVVVTRSNSNSDSGDSEAADSAEAVQVETCKTSVNKIEATPTLALKDALRHAQAQALQHQALMRLQEQQRRRIKMTRAEAAGPVVSRHQDSSDAKDVGAVSKQSSRRQPITKGEAVVAGEIAYEPIAPAETLSTGDTEDADSDLEKEDDAKRFALALEAGTEGTAPSSPFEETTDMQLTNIATPENADVLLGRGAKVRHHPGNRTFRDLVQARRALYATSPKQKTQIAVSIVQAIRRTGGRFIQRDETTGLWNEVGDARASEKTAQALREGQPILKRMISEQLRNRGEADDDVGKRTLASTIVASKHRSRDGEVKKVPSVAEAVKVLESNKHMVPAVMAAIAVLQKNNTNLKLRHTNEVERDMHKQEIHANIVQAAASSVARKEFSVKHDVAAQSQVSDAVKAEDPPSSKAAEVVRRSSSDSSSSSASSSSTTSKTAGSSFSVGDENLPGISSIIPCRLNALSEKKKTTLFSKNAIKGSSTTKGQACPKVGIARHADFARTLPQHTIQEYHEMARQMLGGVPPQR